MSLFSSNPAFIRGYETEAEPLGAGAYGGEAYISNVLSERTSQPAFLNGPPPFEFNAQPCFLNAEARSGTGHGTLGYGVSKAMFTSIPGKAGSQNAWLHATYIGIPTPLRSYIQANPETKPLPNGYGEGNSLSNIEVAAPLPGGFEGSLPDYIYGETGGVPVEVFSPSPTAEGYTGGVPVHALRRSLGSINVFMYGNAEGVTGLQTFQGAFIWIGEPGNSYTHAHIVAPEPIVKGQASYIFGHESEVDGQDAFIISTFGLTDSNRAFTHGLAKEHFGHPAYVHIATPMDSAKYAYVHTTTPAESTHDLYLKGHFAAIGSQAFWLTGLESNWYTTAAYVHIETPINVSVGAFVNGPPAESFIDAFMFGVYIARPVKRAFVQIETPRTTTKSAFIRGHRPQASTKRGYLDGHWAADAALGAFIQIITPRLETKWSYTSGPLIKIASKGAFIDGIHQQEVSKRGYMYGHFITPPSAISAYIHIEEYEDAFRPAYIKVGEPVFVPRPSYMRGLIKMTPSPRHCFLDSRVILRTNTPAFVQIQNPMNAPIKRAFVQIETPKAAPIKRAYIRNVGEKTQPINVYMMGAYKFNDSQSCYIHSETPIEAPAKRCFIRNQPDIFGSVMCYVFETGLGNVSQIVYLNGTRIGEVDVTKKCYMGAKNTPSFYGADIPAFINGGTSPRLSDSHKCFIVNKGVIGYWKLDDGEFDLGTSTIDDSSTLDNDGNLVNWPDWAGGPYREDTC